MWFFITCLFLSTVQAQDCAKKVDYFENLDVEDIRPAIIDIKQYLQQARKSLTPDCSRRIHYLLASLHEINGSTDSAAAHYENSIQWALRCNSDTAIVESFLRATGFYQRQTNMRRSKQMLDSASVYMKRYFAATQHLVNIDKQLAVHTAQSELASSPEFMRSFQRLSATQIYLLRLYHQTKGNYHIYNNEPIAAKKQLLTAYHYAKNNKQDDTERNILNNLGMLLSNEGLYQKAATFFQQALLEHELADDKYSMPNTLINLSFCFQKTKDYNKAEAHAQRAKTIARDAGLLTFFCRASSFQAKALLAANKPAEAEQVMRESIDTAIKKGLQSELAYNYRALAEALLHQSNKWEQSLMFAERSRAMVLQIGDSAYLPYTDLTLGKYYLKSGEHNNALRYTNQSIELAHHYNDLADLDVAYKQLADVYTAMGDYRRANESLIRHKTLEDSLASREVRLSLEDLEQKYESRIKQLTITRLEEEQKKKEAALQHTRSRNRWIAALAIIALLVAGLIFYLYKRLAVQKQTLVQSNKKLEGMTSLQNRIFKIIGHDLKGMILPFDRAGKMMHHYLSKQDGQSALMYAGKLEENALRLTETLNNLLHWSTGQLNGKDLNKESLVLKDVLSELMDSFSEVAAAKGVQLIDGLDGSEIIHADKSSVQIILRNLLSNAIKFTKDGKVTVFSTRTAEDVTLHVQDEGVGMDENKVDDLLHASLQQSTTGTGGERGSGIGFSIVKKMAALNGADVSIKSSKGGGTAVWVSFPAHSES